MALFLSRLAFAFAALLIASMAFVGAVGFLFYAVFLYFESIIPAPLAAIVTALVLIGFSILVLLLGRGLAGSGMRRRRESEGSGGTRIADFLEALVGPNIANYAEKSPFATTGLAFLIGILFGFSPRLRRAATDLLRR